MKKFLIYLASLLLVVFLLDKMVAFSLDQLLERSNFRWMNIFSETPDAYIVGNSRGVNAVNEMQFDAQYDLDILNISYNGLDDVEIEHLLTFVPKDKLVLIEISPFLDKAADHVWNRELRRFHPFKQLRVKDPIREIFQTYYFNNELTLRALYYLLGSDKSWINQGVLADNVVELLSQKIKPLEYYSESLEKFIPFLDENGYQYLFFYAPVHPLYKEKITNWNEINTFLQQKLSNKYLDLSDLFTENKYFADLIHTNALGINVMHKELYSYIRK